MRSTIILIRHMFLVSSRLEFVNLGRCGRRERRLKWTWEANRESNALPSPSILRSTILLMFVMPDRREELRERSTGQGREEVLLQLLVPSADAGEGIEDSGGEHMLLEMVRKKGDVLVVLFDMFVA